MAILGIAAAVLTSTLPKDTIVDGIHTEGIALGGLTLDEAKAKISEHDIFSDFSFTVSSSGKSRTISAADIDLAVDAEATAQKAFDICKTSNKLSDAIKSIQLGISPDDISPVPSVNSEKLDALLYEFGKTVNGELAEASVSVDNDVATITPGTEGQSSDVSEAHEEIIKGLSEEKTTIHITLNKQKPMEFSPETLISTVHVDAKDAEYALEDGKVVIKPHVVGVDAAPEDAAAAAKKVNSGTAAQVKVTTHMPEKTSDALRSRLFTGTLASYSTRYNKSKVNRSANVELAARRINGTVLLPGDVFSYNDIVGKRTAENGFKNAPVYENGKSVDGIGGGVCQVSTTLYSAVLYADLEIVKRQNHSLTVSYVPLGQDATVVDGAIDFQFKNNTDTPIRIDSSAGGGSISISLVGTPVSGKSVKLIHETTATVAPTEKEVNDPSLPSGTRKVTSQGKTGYTISSTKIVYMDGKEISRKSLGNSKYKMVPTEVSIGTGAAATAPAQPAAPKPEAPAATQKPASAPAPKPTEAPSKPAEAPAKPAETTQKPGSAPARPTSNPTSDGNSEDTQAAE